MNDDRVVKPYEANKDAMRTALAGIKLETPDGIRYNFPSRQPPEGYTTIRDSFRYADVHPSWLRTMLAGEKFSNFDEPGLPATIKNARGTWAVAIHALQAYASGMRSTEPSEDAGPSYKYEPQVLKAAKRTLNAAKNRGLSAETVAELQGLVTSLKTEWADGNLGKYKPGEGPADGEEGDDEEDNKPADEADNETVEQAPGGDFQFDFGNAEPDK